MASEWARQEGEKLIDALERIEHSAFYSSSGDFVIQALDAARSQGRLEGMEEAFALATEHCDHGEFAHFGRYECVDALRVQIRARIEELRK